jgi:hypothetical protein
MDAQTELAELKQHKDLSSMMMWSAVSAFRVTAEALIAAG